MTIPAILSAKRAALALAASGTLIFPAAAKAGEHARFLNAPAEAIAPASKLAVEYELKLRLPDGRGLAQLLLEAGVDSDDVAALDRLSSGHAGSGAAGCDVVVSVSRPTGDSGLRLMRVTLMTNAGQTVIERREAGLTIASEVAAKRFLHLV